MTGRTRPWSLSVRLAWRLAAVTLAAILLTAAAIAWRAVATVHDLDDSALQAQAALIAKRLPAAPTAHLSLPEALLAQFRASDAENIFLVFLGGRLAATSDPAASVQLAPDLPPALPPGLFRLPKTPDHRFGMVGLIAPVGPWRVVTLQGREQTSVLLDSLTGHFLAAAVWLLLPIGAVTVLVGVLTIRSGLSPLRQTSIAAAQLGPAQPGARLLTDQLPEEVAPLVHAMNDALARLEQALTAQRRFMAEAAHALRTPLAVLTARLDLQIASPEVEALRHDTDRMARLVGQLLRMARLGDLPLDRVSPVDLHMAAVEAIRGLVPLALHAGVELALVENGPLPPVPGDAAAVVLALTNLIENALCYAPPGSAVEVCLAAPATVTVLDRGPGVPSGDRARIFERFTRGASAHEGGAGLGLAIVAGIAAAHGGRVRCEARIGGGAAFVLVLSPDRRPVIGDATPAAGQPRARGQSRQRAELAAQSVGDEAEVTRWIGDGSATEGRTA